MLQIEMWITILLLYHYALFIESNHDSYWFGFWDWETCSEANLHSYQTFQKCKAFILTLCHFFNLCPLGCMIVEEFCISLLVLEHSLEILIDI